MEDLELILIIADLLEMNDISEGQELVKFEFEKAGSCLLENQYKYYFIKILDQNHNSYHILTEDKESAQIFLYKLDQNDVYVLDKDKQSAYRVRKTVGVEEYPTFVFRNSSLIKEIRTL